MINKNHILYSLEKLGIDFKALTNIGDRISKARKIKRGVVLGAGLQDPAGILFKKPPLAIYSPGKKHTAKQYGTKNIPKTKATQYNNDLYNIALSHEQGEIQGLSRALKKLPKDKDLRTDIGLGVRPVHQGVLGSHISPSIVASESNLVKSLPDGERKNRILNAYLSKRNKSGDIEGIKKLYPNFEYGKTKLNRRQRKFIDDKKAKE